MAITTAYTAVSTCLILADLTLAQWLDDTNPDNAKYLLLYGLFGLGATLLLATRSLVFAYGCVAAGRGIHQDLLGSIMAAPMLFFDENPSGRILNRFAVDLFETESLLPHFLEHVTVCVAFCLMVVVAISIIMPFFLAAVPPLLGLCVWQWSASAN